MDGGTCADKDSDSEDNLPIRFCVKRRVEVSSVEIPRTQQAKRLKKFTVDTLVQMGLAQADASISDASVTPDASNIIPGDETFASLVGPAKQSQQDRMAES